MSDAEPSSHEDIFADAKTRDREFLSRIAEQQDSDIVGVVDASGATGGRGRDEPWSLILHLAGWKLGGSELRTDELLVRMTVSEEALTRYRKQIGAYDIVHLKARVAEHPLGRLQALAVEVIASNHRDAELEAYAEVLQQPVVIQNRELGTFTLDRRVHWFKGKAVWDGNPVRLNLSAREPSSAEEALKTASALWQDQDGWNQRIRDYAVSSLLDLKNGLWLGEDEGEVTPDEFRRRMTLESVTVNLDGSFEFWHDDGDLFWGHSIQIRGSLAQGPTHADIPG